MRFNLEDFTKESDELLKKLQEGREAFFDERYEEALGFLKDAEISAGVLSKRYERVGNVLKMDRVTLGIKGMQLQVYVTMLKRKVGDFERIERDVYAIAQGAPEPENPYFVKIMEASQEFRGGEGYLEMVLGKR